MKVSAFLLFLWTNLSLFEEINSYASFDKIGYCTNSNKSLSIELCKIENKKFSGIFSIMKPISKAILVANFYREENSEFRQVFKAPPIDWCSMAGNGKGKSNTMVKIFILPPLRKYGLDLKCPLKGVIKVENIAIEQKMASIFPNGLYRIDLHAFNGEDNNIANISIVIKVEP